MMEKRYTEGYVNRLVKKIAEKTPLVIATCSVTRELYGYARPVVYIDATLRNVAAEYNKVSGQPFFTAQYELAESIIIARADTYLHNN